MANQLFANNNPYSGDLLQKSQVVYGSVVLAGAAVTTGEPLNWSNILIGVGYNESNLMGNGVVGASSAQTTGFAISGGVCTVTAANNFSVGQSIIFLANTQTLSTKFNGLTFTVATATSSQFTFATSITGVTTTGDVGLAVSGTPLRILGLTRNTITAPVTSLAATVASGGVPAYITVTAANSFLPGANVTFAGLSTTLGAKMNGVSFTVVSSTGSAFVVYSTLTGSAGSDTGTASGQNVSQPFRVQFGSANASGYIYQYVESTGNLFVMQTPTISSGTQAAAPLTALPAAAYPSAVLNDTIEYIAFFSKDR